jgi:hypothetical protein
VTVDYQHGRAEECGPAEMCVPVDCQLGRPLAEIVCACRSLAWQAVGMWAWQSRDHVGLWIAGLAGLKCPAQWSSCMPVDHWLCRP